MKKKQLHWFKKYLLILPFFLLNFFFTQAQQPVEQWFPIGPAPIQNGQTYGSGRVDASGRATVIAVNPENPMDVWLGSANGGAWNSINAATPGMSWKPMTDFESALAIGAIALTDCNSIRCNTVYVGTGENNIRRDTYYGRGLLRLRWVGGEFPFYTIENVGNTLEFFEYGSINDIILDGDDIYVSISEGRTSSGHQVTVVAPPPVSGYGVFKSSNDGESWDIIEGTLSNWLPTDLELINGELYAGFMEQGNGLTGRGIFKLDASGNWCALNPGNSSSGACPATIATLPTINTFDHVEIAAAPSNPEIIYVIFGQCFSVTKASCSPLLYQSMDGGDTWTNITYTSTGTQSMKTFSRYTHALTVHPTNPNIVYYGGLTLNKSMDGGSSFQVIGLQTTHPDHQDIAFPDPGNPDLIYNVNDGGFYFSFDGGECWNSGNYDLQITGFYSVDANTEPIPGTTVMPPIVIGGTQDNGINAFNGPRVWQHVQDADGGDVAIKNPNVMFASKQLISPYRTLTGASLGGFLSYRTGINSLDKVAFYPPYLHHKGSNQLYFGTEILYRTSDTGPANWQPISPDFDPSTFFYPAIETENVISAVGIAPSNANTVYVGLYNGEIWRTNAPCADFSCWTQVGGPGDTDSGLPNAVVTSLAVDPSNSNRVFVTYSGFNLPNGDHVYRSTTGGSGSWTSVSNNLPAIPTHVIKVNPDNGNDLWVGTDRGVYRSETGGSTWDSFDNNGLPNTAVNDIKIDNFSGRVYAATHGRGMFMLTTNPVLHTFEGWVGNSIWDVLVYGEGFLPSGGIGNCTVDIILENGDICATGTVDAYGGTSIRIGSDGSLVTDRQFVWDGRPVIAACLNGNCVGGVDIENCISDPNNLIASVRVTCGGQTAFASISEDCPQQANPPSSILEPAPPVLPGGFTCVEPLSLDNFPFDEDGSIDVLITLASTNSTNGGDRVLCGAKVDYKKTEDTRAIAQRISDAINTSMACSSQQIEATIPELPLDESLVEDFTPPSASIKVSSPNTVGGELILSIRAIPNETTGSCFTMRELGRFTANQLAIMETTILTDSDGAKGGEITFMESSHLGKCQVRVPTTTGQTADSIAANIFQAVMGVVEPGTIECEARQNAYDLQLMGNRLISVMANGLTICSTDPGVGFTSGPKGVNIKDADLGPNVGVSVECSAQITKSCIVPFEVIVDMSEVAPPDSLLGSFSAVMSWDSSLLKPTGKTEFISDYQGVVNISPSGGSLFFNGANTGGNGGKVKIFRVFFEVIGALGEEVEVDVDFKVMAAAKTFRNLTEAIVEIPCKAIITEPYLLGDVNGDNLINSTDALIILSFDAGLFIPNDILTRINNGVGDVNMDWLTSSTDALIILTYEAGLPITFPIGQAFCPHSKENAGRARTSETTVPASSILKKLLPSKEDVELSVNLDLTEFEHLAVGSYTAAVTWNPAEMEWMGYAGSLNKVFNNPVINLEQMNEGKVKLAWANPSGSKGFSNLFNLRFKLLQANLEPSFEVHFTDLASTESFTPLVPFVEKETITLEQARETLTIYPNPFALATTIAYQIPKKGRIKLLVFNNQGQVVEVLEDKIIDAGTYEKTWDTKAKLSSGIYFISLETTENTLIKKVVLEK